MKEGKDKCRYWSELIAKLKRKETQRKIFIRLGMWKWNDKKYDNDVSEWWFNLVWWYHGWTQ